VREKRNIYRTFLGKYEGRGYCEELGVDRRIILRWIFRMWEMGAWIGLCLLRIWIGGGLL